MGKKITVDSSTMMNKIFEIVETSYMFNIPFENIDAVSYTHLTLPTSDLV